MPLLTRASAADLTRSSVTLQAKRFQLFQPMGGARARPFSRAREDGAQRRNPKKSGSARQLIVFFAKLSMRSSRLILILFQSPRTKLATLAWRKSPRLTSGRIRIRKKKLLRGSGCHFCGGFRSVNNDGLLTTLCGGGVDGVQVDALGR